MGGNPPIERVGGIEAAPGSAISGRAFGAFSGLYTRSPGSEEEPCWQAFLPAGGALAFRAIFRPEAAKGVRETYELRIDEAIFHLRVEDGALEVDYGPAGDPTLVSISDGATFRAIAGGTLSPMEAIAAGRWRIEGDPEVFRRFAEIFPPPRQP